MLRLLKATLGEVFDEMLPDDPAARTVLGLPGLYLGLPPRALSFRTFAQMLFSHVGHGASLVEGGVQRIVEELCAAIEQHGGEVLLGQAVTGIVLDGDRASGVRLADGTVLAADAVISNADPLQTFEDMLDFNLLPIGYQRRLARLSPSHSVFTVFAATTCDLAAFPYASQLYFASALDDLDAAFDAAFAATFDGRPAYMVACIPTLLEPTAAPPGEHLVMASITAPHTPEPGWDVAREQWTEGLLDLLEGQFPGFRAGLTFAESATPLAIERHTRNRRGATYAWGNSPGGVGSRLPDHRTPIPGLYLAGAWTAPGSGFARAMNSGRIAAQHVLTDSGSPVAVPRFMS
jgi:prolycopene isomerase